MNEPETSQIRPWIRFWARSIDVALFSFTLGIVLGLLAIVGVPDPFRGLGGILSGVIWMLIFAGVEALFLERWGVTPGKKFLNIHVRTASGENLAYRDGFERSIRVLVQGLGLAIPIVTFFTLIYSYFRLKKHKVTLWDAHGGFTVQHGSIGKAMTVVTSTIIVFFIIAMIVAAMVAGFINENFGNILAAIFGMR